MILELLSFTFLIKVCIVVSLWCNGLHTNIGHGDILNKPYLLLLRWPPVIAKPLLTCVNCMASFHSALILAVIFYFKGIPFGYYLQSWVPVTIISSFLNGTFYLVYLYFEAHWFDHDKKRREDERGF